ncbi:ribonuclease H-like domain-containing protein [Tanacetum coccineum]|uniref:Ribonuclease H-like domain-containing protein n=1 Tax=Tanacetum coccineum TaxID=301880 RepID=A0ABQ5F284_9ASTR
MESQSKTTQTVSTLKLPILKTGDYDLWSMRIEQYLTHIDYALWEVIMNGDAPAIASASTEGHIPPKTAEQKLASKNELKAKSTLLLAIPDEHLLKFYGIKDANTLWEAIKARSEGLDKTYDRFQKLISQLEIHGRNLNFNGKETVGFDKTKVECYNCHRRGHFARECRVPRNQGNKNGDAPRRIIPLETPANTLVVQDGICGYDWSYQAKEGPTNFSLMAHLSSGSSSSSSLNTELAEALRENDDLKLKLEKFETSSMKLTKLINSQISVNNKSRVGFSSQINENELHDCHLNKSEVFKSTSDSSVNEIEEENNQVNDRFKKVEGYHVVPPPCTWNYMPSRPDLSFAGLDDSIYKTNWESDSDDDCVIRPSFEQNKPSYAKINFVKSDENTRKSVIEQHTYRQAKNLRKSQIATKSGLVPVNAAKQSFPRAAASISTARHVNSTALKQKVNNVTIAGPEVVVSTTEGKRENAIKSSACWIWRPTGKGNPQYALEDQGIFDSGCFRHMTGNKSYLTNYQDIDGGFVAFTGSTKGGKITGKDKIRTRKLDFEDVYFVKELKFNLFSVVQMCDKKNSVLFTETECLVLSPDIKLLDETQVLLKVPRQNNMYSFDLKNVVPSGEGKATQSLLFSWVFFLATKDETSGILKTFITGIENHINHKVKIIRCDNGSEFKNNDMNQLCGMKGIKREFNVARTPQQNRVAERNNRTLIEAAKTMLADSLLPTTFWAEAVNTTCYADEGFLVGYSINSKAFRVFNTRTRKVEENLHINFLENKPNVAVKRIFRYLKRQPKLGLWYPRDSPFDLEAFSDSDYDRASLDRKSTIGGCQFLGKRLISWQCKKQTIVSNSTTKVEYVAAANCCGQVLWIQNQMLDYGFNFMNTKIHIDNESTICIVKNPVFHSKTKHIKIRHHFIRDSYEKKLVQMIKIHTDHNVADLLIKAFDISRKAKRTTEISQSSGPIHLVADETVYKEWEDRMERAATTASSLEAEQDNGNINRTQSMATLNESFPQGTDSGSGPRCQDTILGVQKLKLGLRLHLNSPMIHLS